jgi:Cft2 family RNA processing exonuclease
VLTDVLLRDSVRIMEQEQLKPDGEIPLYNHEQVDAFLGRIQIMGFRQPFTPLSSSPEVVVQFIPAGHILGPRCSFSRRPRELSFIPAISR